MNPATHALQRRHLDRALLALIEERARLCAEGGEAKVAMEDLLRRTAHGLDPVLLRETFALIERLSEGGRA